MNIKFGSKDDNLLKTHGKDFLKDKLANNEFVNIDEKFRHTCHGCGRCCTNKNIPLFHHDIWRISNYFHMEVIDFLEKYTHYNMMQTSGLPCVLLDMSKFDNMCCLVKADINNGWQCSLPKTVRPHICRDFPLGTVSVTDLNNNEVTVYVTKINTNCGAENGEEHTVKDYISYYYNNIDIEETSKHIIQNVMDEDMSKITEIKYAANIIIQIMENGKENIDKKGISIFKNVLKIDSVLASALYVFDNKRPLEDQEQEIIDKVNNIKKTFVEKTGDIIDLFKNTIGYTPRECIEKGYKNVNDIIEAKHNEDNMSFDHMFDKIINDNSSPASPNGDDLRDSLRD